MKRIKKISKLNTFKNNVLFFDVPIFCKSKMRRQFFGDLFATKYLSEFYDEITRFSKKLKNKLYIKPKYSIQNNNNNVFYNEIIYELILRQEN